MDVVSRRWVWLVGVGGIYGCGYRFPHIAYPYILLYLLFFAATSILFVHLKKNVFRSCSITTCNLCKNFSAQYKHTYRRLRASHGSHMKGCT